MRMTRRAVGLAAAVAAFAAAQPAAQQVQLADVLRAAASYIVKYSETLQAVGAEEDYLQLEVSGGRMRLTRRLGSEVAFVGIGLGRVAIFRDVFSRDGNPIRERDQRLLKLLQFPAVRDPLVLAQQFTDDGMRHYVSQNAGLFDEMLQPLALLRTENATKVSFRLESVKTTAGVQMATLRFSETSEPHVINSPIPEPASGRFVVEVATGIVRETQLVISNKNTNLRTTVVYALQPGLGLWLPSKMDFQSDLSSVGAGNSAPSTVAAYDIRESLEGHASYSKYQQVPVKLNVRVP